MLIVFQGFLRDDTAFEFARIVLSYFASVADYCYRDACQGRLLFYTGNGGIDDISSGVGRDRGRSDYDEKVTGVNFL